MVDTRVIRYICSPCLKLTQVDRSVSHIIKMRELSLEKNICSRSPESTL